MLEVDLHTHTLFSTCGMHTVLELLTRAKEIGLKGIAITDHGPALGGRLKGTFFNRFKSPFPEVVVYKGVECNILEKKGEIDFPKSFLPYLDVVLLGIHLNIPKGLSVDEYTDMLISAIENNPGIDIITHPNEMLFPVDYSRLCHCAADRGIAIELNNSRSLYKRSTNENVIALLEQCIKSHCRVAVASDAHAILELGCDESVSPLLEKTGFPTDLLVTKDAQSVEAFLRERKGLRGFDL